MNNDHSSDVSMYLQFYSKLPEAQADTGVMEDISLEGMTFTTKVSPTSTVTTYIPFKEALKSVADARAVLVDMSGEAAAGLGLSKTKVDSYKLPSPIGFFVGASFLQALAIFAVPEPFVGPGTLYRKVLLFDNEVLANGVIEYHWVWFVLLLAAHFGETALMAKKMKRYRVKRGTDVWWKWMFTCFIVGFDSFTQLRKVVASKRH